MTRYVLGFAFPNDLTVVLTLKLRPEWMAGLLNGVGGKIEPEEKDVEAMSREFFEETGVYAMPGYWKEVATMRFPESTGEALACEVVVFRARSPIFAAVKTKTDERVGIYAVERIPYMLVVPNLRWLVPLAIHYDLSRPPIVITEGARGG